MSENWQDHAPKVVPFPNGEDDLDHAGYAVFDKVQMASKIAAENTERAMEVARKLLHQLQAAEDRIATLEAEKRWHAERADRAEQWLLRISSEIENSFVPAGGNVISQSLGETGPPSKYIPKKSRS